MQTKKTDSVLKKTKKKKKNSNSNNNNTRKEFVKWEFHMMCVIRISRFSVLTERRAPEQSNSNNNKKANQVDSTKFSSSKN